MTRKQTEVTLTGGEHSLNMECHAGTSNKFYRARLIPQGDGYVIATEWGPCGGRTSTGSKTPNGPLPFADAARLFVKLQAELLGKQYLPVEGEMPAAPIASAPVTVSEWQPQLLNAIEDAQAQALLIDPAFGLQEKLNGVNRITGTTEDGEPFAVNKTGEPVPMTDALARELRRLHERIGRIVLPGEWVNDHLAVHDALWCYQDLRNVAFVDRYSELYAISPYFSPEVLTLVQLHVTKNDKIAAYMEIDEAGREGVVFKRLAAPYRPGRPASGGDQLKYKFWADEPAHVIVAGYNGDKASFKMEMIDRSGARVFVGNCGTSGQPLPPLGAIVEIKYLYVVALPPRGCLVQPGYLGVKDLGVTGDCRIEQLKVKDAPKKR